MPNTKNQEGKGRRIASGDDAIADAKRRITDLKFSLKIFTAKKKAGEPWPNTQT